MEKTEEERYTERLGQVKSVLAAMFVWASSRAAAPKSALGKAFHYLNEPWPCLTNYLKDGRLAHSNTPKGATGSAVVVSLIQTAVENGLEPYKYLIWLLTK